MTIWSLYPESTRWRKADYVIARDKDLLADRHPIVTPASFWARHGE